MALKDLYTRRLDRYSNTDHEWVQYIHDHYAAIRATAGMVDFDMFEANSMHYRLHDFMDRNNIPASIVWIVLLINQLDSEKDFVNIPRLLLPNLKYIETLRERYDTVKSNYTATRANMTKR